MSAISSQPATTAVYIYFEPGLVDACPIFRLPRALAIQFSPGLESAFTIGSGGRDIEAIELFAISKAIISITSALN